MRLCDKCGTWHFESPAPRNCKGCGKRMGSGMVQTPGDPERVCEHGREQQIGNLIVCRDCGIEIRREVDQ